MSIKLIRKKGKYFLLVFAVLFASATFLGCEGDDGATGQAGPPGAPGPGAQANETCVICHSEGEIADIEVAHDTTTGIVTATINSLVFSNDGAGNLQAVVNFDFTALDTSGNPVAVDLTEPISATDSRMARVRFTVGRLVPAAAAGDPDTWDFYGPRSHREGTNMVNNGGGNYTFTDLEMNTLFADFDPSLTHRVGIEIYNLPSGLLSVNPTLDVVPGGGAVTSREIVTTDACNECHNPLGYTPRFHGSRRVEIKHCQLCHNPNDPLAPQTATGDPATDSVPIPFVKLVHGIHTAQDLLIFEDGENHGDFTEVTFCQDERNCTKCHQGGADSDNWKTQPTREACGSCHVDVDFDTGANHPGGAQANNSGCTLCHQADVDGAAPAISRSHRTENVTPNNPDLPAGLSQFTYFIDDVTVDPATGVASVDFRIERDGAPFDLQTWDDGVDTTFTSRTPTFLLAWALPQDGVNSPADYTNTSSPDPPSTTTGNGAGDAASISIGDLWDAGEISGDATGYTATITTLPFPAGATMRAVALQSYFQQIVGGENVGRHAPSVMQPVTGDAVRRQVVKSGYDSVTGEPFGCLECHETLELHGGSRVNNPQVCVFCHNPNKSSSGRTADPSQPSTVSDPADDPFLVLGPDPLQWPEATNNLKNMVHGIHAATDRPYHFVRNRLNGIYYNWSEITFPGDLRFCEKCHLEGTYRPENLPAGALWNVERTTTGDPNETRADIIAARSSVPNLTDLVDSPIAGACYYCHDDGVAKSHILLQGGQLSLTREDSLELP